MSSLSKDEAKLKELEDAALSGRNNKNVVAAISAQYALKQQQEQEQQNKNKDPNSNKNKEGGGGGGFEFKAPAFARYLGVAPGFTEPPKEVTLETLNAINSTSNQVHSALDIMLSCVAYLFGALMQFHGQGSFFTFMSMFGAGAYLTSMSQLRHVMGPAPEIWQGEAQAAILWWIASFRQFREFRTLKWCGYASWSGLAISAYFGFRAILANMEFTPPNAKPYLDGRGPAGRTSASGG